MKKPHPSLEQWEHEATEDHEPNFREKRKRPRKDASVYGIFETKNEQFRTSTKNVSAGGVLIDPEINLSLHEDLYMTFFDRKLKAPIATNGKVVRVDSDGVGIQFDLVIPVMSSL
ncbi:MAG: PilZ domain-containing protein [Desulfobacterales bacterium]|nr:MAG: PilZ domain-containing protein [Desulfobacterales bacterium]